jgi:hypothetical protein
VCALFLFSIVVANILIRPFVLSFALNDSSIEEYRQNRHLVEMQRQKRRKTLISKSTIEFEASLIGDGSSEDENSDTADGEQDPADDAPRPVPEKRISISRRLSRQLAPALVPDLDQKFPYPRRGASIGDGCIPIYTLLNVLMVWHPGCFQMFCTRACVDE